MDRLKGGNSQRWRLRKVLLLINIPVTSALIMAYATQYISPDKFWPLIFFGMGFPFILLLHLIVTVTWFLRSYKVGLINLAIVLLGWNPLWRTFSFHCGKAEAQDSTSFKVMTYNVRLFDYYNWSRNIHTRHWMYDFLKNQQPDILCMQEFFHDNTGYFPTLDTLREVNSIKHMHLENYQKLKIDQM